MLRLYRRHRLSCPHRSQRYRRCACPIYVQGSLGGERVRRALDLTAWEAASDLIARWNASGMIGASKEQVPEVGEAISRFIADAEARNLAAESVTKIRDALQRRFLGFCDARGYRRLRQLGVDEIRQFRNHLAQHYAPNSVRGRLGYVRALLRFCAESSWITTNPALAVKPPRTAARDVETFTGAEIDAMLWAAGRFNPRGIYGPGNRIRIRAMILLLRFSGLRISDASILARDRLVGDKLKVRTLKTGSVVYCPLPPHVVSALAASPSDDPQFFFWNGRSRPTSAVKIWESTFARVFELAEIADGKRFIHNFRHTFATDLLERGIPSEDVAALLGNSVKIVEKHYSHFVKTRRERLEQRVRALWTAADTEEPVASSEVA